MATTYKGIDVSQWQGANVDFNKVKKAGYTFVIIRCNNWNVDKNDVEKDSCFETNYKKAKAAGLNVGVYYYTWERSIDGARQDAKKCLEYIKGKQFEMPVYFDLEWHRAFEQGSAVCSGMVEAFCDALEKAGYFAGLYISRCPLINYISSAVANRYALWIADYDVPKCQYNGYFGIWQHTDKGAVDGIQSRVDLDIAYTDYSIIIKNKGLNGFTKAAADTKPTTAKATTEKTTTTTTTKTPTVASLYNAFQKKYLGKAVDYDGVAGVQCVDLVDQYLKECYGITGVWVDGAKDLYNKFDSYPALKEKFTKVPNTRELIIKKGDIVVWGGGSWGHTGIGNGKGDIDTFESLEENTLGQHEPTQIVKHYFNGTGGNDGCNPVLGVLRPKKIK